MIIATVVVNQLIGPPLMRWALRQVGDAMRGDSENAEKVVVVGVSNGHNRMLDSLSMMQWDIVEAHVMVMAATPGLGVQLGVAKADFAAAVAKDVADGRHKTSSSGGDIMAGGYGQKTKFRLLDPIDGERPREDGGVGGGGEEGGAGDGSTKVEGNSSGDGEMSSDGDLEGGAKGNSPGPSEPASFEDTTAAGNRAGAGGGTATGGDNANASAKGGDKDDSGSSSSSSSSNDNNSNDDDDDEDSAAEAATLIGRKKGTVTADDVRWPGFRSSVNTSDLLLEPEAVMGGQCADSSRIVARRLF